MMTSPTSTPKATARPPRRITLPTQSTYVFSSSRNPRAGSASPGSEIDQAPMATNGSSSSAVFSSAHSPYSERPRTRPVLNERHLARHGAGAQDLRAALVYARTPAGFIPFETAPASPQLGPPPTYDPSHNPFFPPLVVLGGGGPSNMHTMQTSHTLATVPEASPPLPLPEPVMPSSPPTITSTLDSRPSTRPAPSAASHSSSQSSTSTLYSKTEISVNARSPSSSRRSSQMSVSSAHTQKGLSLTELFAADWASSAPPPPSNSSLKRRERRTKENAEAESRARKHRRAAKGEKYSSSSSDNDRNSATLAMKASKFISEQPTKHSKTTAIFPKVVDTCTPDHPTKWTPD